MCTDLWRWQVMFAFGRSCANARVCMRVSVCLKEDADFNACFAGHGIAGGVSYHAERQPERLPARRVNASRPYASLSHTHIISSTVGAALRLDAALPVFALIASRLSPRLSHLAAPHQFPAPTSRPEDGSPLYD